MHDNLFKTFLLDYEFAQDVEERSAVAEVLEFDGGVESCGDIKLYARTGGDGEGLSDFEVSVVEIDGEEFFSGEFERVGRLAVFEFEGKHAHSDKIGSVDSFEGFRDNGADAEQFRAFGGPVATGARAVLLSGENDGLVFVFNVFLGGVENIETLSGGHVQGLGSDLSLHEFVADSDVCESASGHDEVVSSARAVGIEVFGIHAVTN